MNWDRCSYAISNRQRDAVDSQTQCPGRDGDLGYFPDLFPHQGGADRWIKRNLSLLQIHLVGAYDFVFHLDIRVEIRKFDQTQKAYPVFGKGIRVNDSGMFQNLLKETNPAYGLRLHTLCFTIARIIATVALRGCLREIFPHLGIDLADKAVQLRLNLIVSFFWQIFHS